MSGKPRPPGRQRRTAPVAAVAAGPSKIKDSAQKIWGIVGRVGFIRHKQPSTYHWHVDFCEGLAPWQCDAANRAGV